MKRKSQIIKGLLFSLSISIFLSCQKAENVIPDSNISSGVATKATISLSSIDGSWTLTKTKNSFPADAKAQLATSSEVYEFNSKLGTFKRYVNNKIEEEGVFTVNLESNSISFLTDSTTSKIIFEGNELIIGLRVPKGATLIDYDTYHYYTKK